MIVMKLDKQPGSTAANVPVKMQSNMSISTLDVFNHYIILRRPIGYWNRALDYPVMESSIPCPLPGDTKYDFKQPSISLPNGTAMN